MTKEVGCGAFVVTMTVGIILLLVFVARSFVPSEAAPPAATMGAQSTPVAETPIAPAPVIQPAAAINHEATKQAIQAVNGATELEAARLRYEAAQTDLRRIEREGADKIRVAELELERQKQDQAAAITLENIRRDNALEVEAAKQETVKAWAQYERAQAERIRAEQEAVNVWPRAGMVLAALILVVVFARLAWRGRERSEAVTDEDELTSYEPRPEWLPQPKPIIQVQADNEVMQYDAPITPAQARALIDAGGLLGPLSFRRVQERGITRAAWNEIRMDLVPTFAEYDKAGAIILNLAGIEMVSKTAPPTPHSPPRVPVQGNSADESRHDTAQHSPDGGGGGAYNQESESE